MLGAAWRGEVGRPRGTSPNFLRPPREGNTHLGAGPVGSGGTPASRHPRRLPTCSRGAPVKPGPLPSGRWGRGAQGEQRAPGGQTPPPGPPPPPPGGAAGPLGAPWGRGARGERGLTGGGRTWGYRGGQRRIRGAQPRAWHLSWGGTAPAAVPSSRGGVQPTQDTPRVPAPRWDAPGGSGVGAGSRGRGCPQASGTGGQIWFCAYFIFFLLLLFL